MKLKFKIICICLAAILLSMCLFGCVNKPLWSEDYVDITYDDNGDPIINFSDNLTYTPYEGELGFAKYNIGPRSEFSQDLDAVLSVNAFQSLYLIKVIKRYTQEEAEKLAIYIDEYPYNETGYYDVVLVYDFLKNEEVNESVIFAGSRSIDQQTYGKPSLSVGDCWIGIVIEHPNIKNLYSFSSLGSYVKNQENISQDTFVYAWLYDDELECIELELADEEKIIEGEFKDNPLQVKQKFLLGDVVNFLLNALEERGYEIQK